MGEITINRESLSAITRSLHVFLTLYCGFFGAVGLYATINFGEIGWRACLFYCQALIGIIGMTAFILGLISALRNSFTAISLLTILCWNILCYIHILINETPSPITTHHIVSTLFMTILTASCLTLTKLRKEIQKKIISIETNKS